MPNGCITETGRAATPARPRAGQCRVGGYALRDALRPRRDARRRACSWPAAASGATRRPDPPPRYTLGGVTALEPRRVRRADDDRLLQRRRGARSPPSRSRPVSAPRPAGSTTCPTPCRSRRTASTCTSASGRSTTPWRGSGLALFRVVPSNEPAPGPGVRVDAPTPRSRRATRTPSSSSSCSRPAIRATTIQYTTYDETATAGTDYTRAQRHRDDRAGADDRDGQRADHPGRRRRAAGDLRPADHRRRRRGAHRARGHGVDHRRRRPPARRRSSRSARPRSRATRTGRPAVPAHAHARGRAGHLEPELVGRRRHGHRRRRTSRRAAGR